MKCRERKKKYCNRGEKRKWQNAVDFGFIELQVPKYSLTGCINK